MTAKEKAKELVSVYRKIDFIDYLGNEVYETLSFDAAKKCALIAVDELIESWADYSGMYDQKFFNSELQYWQEVKTEIENYEP